MNKFSKPQSFLSNNDHNYYSYYPKLVDILNFFWKWCKIMIASNYNSNAVYQFVSEIVLKLRAVKFLFWAELVFENLSYNASTHTHKCAHSLHFVDKIYAFSIFWRVAEKEFNILWSMGCHWLCSNLTCKSGSYFYVH